VNKQDTCFRACKTPELFISTQAFEDLSHVIVLKHLLQSLLYSPGKASSPGVGCR
jgi:hypothetical protein